MKSRMNKHSPWAVRLSWLENAYFHFHCFSASDFDCNVGQGDFVLLCDHGSLVGLCVQDYKSLCAAVTICATLVNIYTDRYVYKTYKQKTFDQFI